MSEPIFDGWTLAVFGLLSFCLGAMTGAALVRA